MRTVRAHAGWQGQFSTLEQHGAYPNGTRIRKRLGDPGDQAIVGSTGTVLGSLSNPNLGIGYFVEWDHLPRVAVFIMGRKIVRMANASEPRDREVHVWPGGTPLGGRT